MSLKPARKIRANTRSVTGKFPSLKTNTSHHYESSLERDYISLLEFDRTVASFSMQPVTITYSQEDKMARYTPDVAVHYLVECNLKPLLVEIKHAAELVEKQDYLRPKFLAAEKYASDNGYEFKVITEKEIRTDYLFNVRFLAGYLRGSIESKFIAIIMSEINKHGSITPFQLTSSLDKEISAYVLFALWQMLATRILQCDLQHKLNMNTRIWKS